MSRSAAAGRAGQRLEEASPGPGPGPDADALRLAQVGKRLGNVEIVRGLDLVVRRGELLALLGPSGCGKTTTLRLIAGFEQPDQGTIEIAGVLVARGAPAPLSEAPEHRRVGMVFQDYALFPHLSAARNVAFGLGKRVERREQRVSTALAAVDLAAVGERMPSQLSGGQQQRVALARALAPNPDLVLLDEPFSNLDAELRVSVREEVRGILRSAGATAILVTHDQEEALSLADRVALMFDGTIVQTGSPEELYHRPATREAAAFVGDAQFLPADAAGRRALCQLGDVPLASPATGPVDAMLRPEQIRLVPAAEAGETNATVLSRRFFGHDQMLTVQLDRGGVIRARVGAYGGIRPGDRVQTAIRGAALAFPRVG